RHFPHYYFGNEVSLYSEEASLYSKEVSLYGDQVSFYSGEVSLYCNEVSGYCKWYYTTVFGSFLPCIGYSTMEFFSGRLALLSPHQLKGFAPHGANWSEIIEGLADEITRRKALNRCRRSQDEHQSRRCVLVWNEGNCWRTQNDSIGACGLD